MVISLQIAILVFGSSTSENISIVLKTLFADSKKIFVILLFLRPIAIFLFASLFFGKNPLKENLSVGKPERMAAFITAEGPGSTVKEISSLIHLFINGNPGSEISGAPASDKIATLSPSLIHFIIFILISSSLCSWNEIVFFTISI